MFFLFRWKRSLSRTTKKTIKNAAAFAEAFVEKGYRVVTGGTENHLVMVDLRPKDLTGDIAEEALESVGIIVNRNVIPGDPQKPEVTSGIRVGSPAISSRGMGEKEVGQIVELIDQAIVNRRNPDVLEQVSAGVVDLCRSFPVYKGQG